MVVAVPDIITCAKLGTEIFTGYDFTGDEFPVFLLILSWVLQQCSATALPVMVTASDCDQEVAGSTLRCFIFKLNQIKKY